MQIITQRPVHYSLIEELVIKISDLHKIFSEECLDDLSNRLINLKKKQVRHIIDEKTNFITEEFYSLIQNYQEKLNRLVIETDLEYEYNGFDLRLRIKQNESIINKLFHYHKGKSEEGKIALNKCLNDLLGFRILIDDFDHNCYQFNELYENIRKTCKMRKDDASKDNYRGTHIYFLADNLSFPWELQVWNRADEYSNQISHQEHKSKRQYIKWPATFKNA
ncbi:hypothetical protein ACEU2D_00035 [Brevibacillus laterosporus]|uniref:hypothetical protein n=1 Tax=Brevibacillus laterosporus TaxID=1465 RepID=UPI0035A61699